MDVMSKKTRGLLALVVGLVAAVAFGLAPAGGVAASDNFWREDGGLAKPVLPNGYNPLPSLSGLVKQLNPAVVNIYTTQVIRPHVGRMFRRDPRFGPYGQRQDPLERFFFGGPQREFKTRSLGSGFIVSEDGYVITNAHVVDHASEVKVKMADERTFDAKIVGLDTKTDVALLKVSSKGKLPTVVLGDSDAMEVGDWVIAIGNPFGLSHTVTAGIISAKARQIGQGPYDDFLQTDASINPGNSGGPLFDSQGRVVGINAAIVAQGSGIGFAVPINMAKDLLPQLRESGKVRRGWLGVGIQDLTKELAPNFGLEGDQGVLVSQVFEGSPADRAGLKPGDVILSLNGKQVADSHDLTRRVATLNPDSVASLKVNRKGKTRTFKVRLGEREAGEAVALGEPAPAEAEPASKEALGVELAPLTPETARRLGLDENTRGLVVVGVDESGPTADILRNGDLILEINRRRVTRMRDLDRALKAGATSDQVLLLVQRGQSQVFVVVKK